MPAYDYDCAACGRRFEVSHSVYADGPTTCPLCGKGPVRKAITAAAIHYKGSGWAKKERRATATSATSKAAADGSTPAGGSGSQAPGDDGAAAAPTKKAEKTTEKATERTTEKSTDSSASSVRD
jgi:putative FmdB family regulatory protein